jgi:hypothetical protein
MPQYRVVGRNEDPAAVAEEAFRALMAEPYQECRWAPQRERPLDTNEYIIEPFSPEYISKPAAPEVVHVCIAFSREYNNFTNTGGVTWICHLKYKYPNYSISIGRDEQVMGQIQGLPPPHGAQITRHISDLSIGETIQTAAMEALTDMSKGGRDRELITILGYLKESFEKHLPNNVGVLTERYRIRFVTVINEQQEVFRPKPVEEKHSSGGCCQIM